MLMIKVAQLMIGVEPSSKAKFIIICLVCIEKYHEFLYVITSVKVECVLLSRRSMSSGTINHCMTPTTADSVQ